MKKPVPCCAPPGTGARMSTVPCSRRCGMVSVEIHGLCRNRGVGGRQGREGDAGDRFPGQVFRNVLAGGGFSGVRFRIRLSGIAVKEGFQLARRQFQQTLPERFFAEQVGPFRLACRLFGGLSRNRGRFRGNGLFLGRFYAGTQQEKQEYAQQDAEEQGSEEALLLRRMMAFPAVAPAIPAAVPAAVPVAPAVLVPAEGPAARPAPGTALRAAVPATAAAEAPVAAVAAPVTPEGVSPFSGSPQSIGAVASSVPCGSRPQLTSTGWPLTTKTLSAEGMNSALRSRTPPGVSSRWGVTASRARRRAARACSASPASRRRGGADAFQRRIPGNGGVARRCGLPGNGFGPQGAGTAQGRFFSDRPATLRTAKGARPVPYAGRRKPTYPKPV